MTTVLPAPRASQYGDQEALQQLLAYQQLATQPGLLAQQLAGFPQPRSYAHLPSQPQPPQDRPYVDALWLLHADSSTAPSSDRKADVCAPPEPQPRSAFVKWSPQLSKLSSKPSGSPRPTLEPIWSHTGQPTDLCVAPASRCLATDSAAAYVQAETGRNPGQAGTVPPPGHACLPSAAWTATAQGVHHPLQERHP